MLCGVAEVACPKGEGEGALQNSTGVLEVSVAVPLEYAPPSTPPRFNGGGAGGGG